MHEYHIVEGIVKQILEKARSSNAKKITGVTLVLDELSGLKEESIRMYFDNLSKGNMLEGAKLVIKPAKGIPANPGREFYIDNIEIEYG